MALTLYRREGESILLSGGIRVRFVERHGRGVRLAIDAPRDVRILREELATPEQEAALGFRSDAQEDDDNGR